MTWTPPSALVEKVALALAQDMDSQVYVGILDNLGAVTVDGELDIRTMATQALAASGLGDAVELLRHVEKALGAYILRYEAGRMNIGFEYVSGRLVVEARTLLASLDATEGTKT